VAAGERIPVDAVVLRGEGGIDEAMLTGEAQPRMVRAGDELSSGTLCLDAALELRTIRTADKSNAARIIDMVWNAAQAKARPEKFISSFARIYTPLVLLGAALLAVLPPLLFQQPFSEWFSRSLILLVISCPCALVVSVPLTYFAGIGGLSSRGILVKGAVHIDTLRKIRYAAFDKTGTLTWGRFEVLGVEPAQGMRVEELTGMAAAAESLSRHPVARAICRNFDALGVAGDVREIAGRGVEAAVNGVAVLAGSRGLLEERGVIVSETAGSLGTAGTEVFVAAGGRYLGRVVLGDGLKEGAAEALAALRGLGVEELLCFTGDGAASAEAALGGLNLDGIVSGLSPAGKIAALEGLLAKGSVLFVGDGINDAPVLARADLGVAMGRSAADVNASDAALEAADVIVASGDLRRIPEALARARKIHQVVMENVAFALTAKLVFLALAVLGLTGMWAALVADVGVCLAAVLHSLRARRG
jgi:Cd2+/Zn2+-exporting ATPase